MTAEFKRTDRIAEFMMRELSVLIQRGVKDPRLPKFVTITTVKVSKDLSHAKIYFTAFGSDAQAVLQILNGASGYLRTLLAKSMKLRIVPELHFVYDESIEYAKHLSRLIDEVNSPSDNRDDHDAAE